MIFCYRNYLGKYKAQYKNYIYIYIVVAAIINITYLILEMYTNMLNLIKEQKKRKQQAW